MLSTLLKVVCSPLLEEGHPKLTIYGILQRFEDFESAEYWRNPGWPLFWATSNAINAKMSTSIREHMYIRAFRLHYTCSTKIYRSASRKVLFWDDSLRECSNAQLLNSDVWNIRNRGHQELHGRQRESVFGHLRLLGLLKNNGVVFADKDCMKGSILKEIILPLRQVLEISISRSISIVQLWGANMRITFH